MMLFIAKLYFVRLSEKIQLSEPPLVPISSDNRRSTVNAFSLIPTTIPTTNYHSYFCKVNANFETFGEDRAA